MPSTPLGAIDKLKNFFYGPKAQPVEYEIKQRSVPLIEWSGGFEKALHPYYGAVSGVYMAQTGMPWLSADARKAVKTEWFWQPIRGQPRRVDTNELRKYSNTVWVQAIVQTILNQVSSINWDIIPKDETITYDEAEEDIKKVKAFLENPNNNKDSLSDLFRSWLKDVLEIDAGVIVKVFTIDSYDFEHLEPRSGAPLLKPLTCPECTGTGIAGMKALQQKALRTLGSIEKAERELPKSYKQEGKEWLVVKPDYSEVKGKMMSILDLVSPPVEIEATPCPFCNGTGRGRQLKEIYVQDGASFLKDADRTGWTYGYWQYSYAIPAHPMWFCPDEVIYFMETPRSQGVYGYAATQGSLELIKTLEYSVRHNMAMFLDGAVPDGVVSVEDMSDEEMIRMKTTWEREIKGQAHKTIFLNKKTSWTPFAFNNRDIQFTELQMQGWTQVMSNFGVTPTDLGLTEDVNRATAGNQVELTRRKAIRPKLKKMEYLLNSQLLPEILGKEANQVSVKFQFIVDDPMEERMHAELDEIYLRMGVKTVNEVRTEMGLEPLEETTPGGLAQTLVQQGIAKPEQVMPEGKTPEQTGAEETEEEGNTASEDVKGKDYSAPFQGQVPFITTIQNLSTPTPWAQPKQGHVNTQYPYSAISSRCPGCGQNTLQNVISNNPSIQDWYRCNTCNRTFEGKDALQQAIGVQEEMHDTQDPLAPKVSDSQTALMGNRVPELVQSDLFASQVEALPEKQDKFATKKSLKKKDESVRIISTLDEWLTFEHAPIRAYIKRFLEKHKFSDVEGITPAKAKKLKAIFLNAFEHGKNLDELAEDIQNAGFDQIRADAIARTETTRIANEAKLIQAEETEFDEVMFHVVKDRFTCERCEALDGAKVSISTARGMIPVHPNCRCRWSLAV